MAWRSLHLSQAARLSLRDHQIVVDRADGIVSLPLEDLAWVVLDTPQVTLTAAVLSAMMERGVALVSTGQAHMPNGVMLPFQAHYRQADVARRQTAMTRSFRKRLWQITVSTKIANQAAVLASLGLPGRKALVALAVRVNAGDPENLEAQAARHYWGELFVDFRREDGNDKRNKLLNYGYAIVRSALARSLVASGALPAFGIHHDSATNAFNLVDDLMEPFRPFVDKLAVKVLGDDADLSGDLGLEDRRGMAAIMLAETRGNGEATTLLVAAEATAASFVRALATGSPADVVYPNLPP